MWKITQICLQNLLQFFSYTRSQARSVQPCNKFQNPVINMMRVWNRSVSYVFEVNFLWELLRRRLNISSEAEKT